MMTLKSSKQLPVELHLWKVSPRVLDSQLLQHLPTTITHPVNTRPTLAGSWWLSGKTTTGSPSFRRSTPKTWRSSRTCWGSNRLCRSRVWTSTTSWTITWRRCWPSLTKSRTRWLLSNKRCAMPRQRDKCWSNLRWHTPLRWTVGTIILTIRNRETLNTGQPLLAGKPDFQIPCLTSLV